MRRILSILLILSVLLSMGITTAKALEEGDEILFVDFENVQDGKVVGTGGNKEGDDGYNKWFTVVKDPKRDSNVLRITNEKDVANPWMFWWTEVIPGATYEFTANIRWEDVGTKGYPRVFLEYYTGEAHIATDNRGLTKVVTKGGGWQECSQEFLIPDENITAVKLYIALHTYGEIYWDDLSFRLKKHAPYFSFVDSGFFYYRDVQTGTAKVTMNSIAHTIDKENRVNFQLLDLDGKTVLEQASFPTVENEIEWQFPTRKMTEVAKSYTLRTEYFDKEGTLLESRDNEVLIYNRPKNLTKEGYILNDDGSITHPVIAGGLYPRTYATVKKMGINVSNCCYQAKDLEYVIKALDQAQKDGMKLIIPMYSNMLPAGHPNNVEATVKCIEAVKNHPALLGYKIMDEPFGHLADAGGPQGMYKWLQDSYKLIREHDQEHLIYNIENYMNYAHLAANCADLLGIDPYIGIKTDQRGSLVAKECLNVGSAVAGKKPMVAIVQAWNWNGDSGDVWYEPTSNDIRSFLYQALISGMAGIGYYRIENTTPNSKDPAIWELELGKGVQYFADNELEDAQKAFITGEYPTFAQNTDEESPYWYKVFVKGKTLYAVVINRENKVNEIEIPLTSLDGSVTIGDFKAEPDAISGMETITGHGTLKATLSEAQVVRFKLTLRDDLSGLTTSAYSDIYDYTWAKSSIDRMYQKGVTNQKGVFTFAPGEQITRGDFAMFLVKTLGLTAAATDNFEDVNPYAEYAEAISIGKALGILKGTDGVNFNPETPISRQDFMVICARGMRLVKALEDGDASQFADAASISDYAVADIAAMVKANIVGGYEDGTVRPLGNATRAEAAVIMDRITNWSK